MALFSIPGLGSIRTAINNIVSVTLPQAISKASSASNTAQQGCSGAAVTGGSSGNSGGGSSSGGSNAGGGGSGGNRSSGYSYGGVTYDTKIRETMDNMRHFASACEDANTTITSVETRLPNIFSQVKAILENAFVGGSSGSKGGTTTYTGSVVTSMLFGSGSNENVSFITGDTQPTDTQYRMRHMNDDNFDPADIASTLTFKDKDGVSHVIPLDAERAQQVKDYKDAHGGHITTKELKEMLGVSGWSTSKLYDTYELSADETAAYKAYKQSLNNTSAPSTTDGASGAVTASITGSTAANSGRDTSGTGTGTIKDTSAGTQIVGGQTVVMDTDAVYDTGTRPLTPKMGVKYFDDPNMASGQHKETWYPQSVLPGGGLNIPGRHVADDGTIRDKDGFIVVAAHENNYSKGDTLMTSRGPAKVYDTGCGEGTIDIYCDWALGMTSYNGVTL